MTPMVKFVVKCFLIGLYGALVVLQVALPGISVDELVAAPIVGAIGALGYAGIGAATPLEHPKGE